MGRNYQGEFNIAKISGIVGLVVDIVNFCWEQTGKVAETFVNIIWNLNNAHMDLFMMLFSNPELGISWLWCEKQK